MQNNFSNLNGFPTDNSPSTQLKYDIVASKFMTGIENHHKRNSSISVSEELGLIGVLAQVLIAIIGMCGAALFWIWNRL